MVKKPTIAFRVDAGPEIGFGHLKRCLVLAAHIPRRFETLFFCRPDPAAQTLLEQAGKHHVTVDDNPGEPQDWASVLQAHEVSVLVLDLKTAVDEETIKTLQRSGVKTVLLDNPGSGRRVADLVVYPVAHVETEALPVMRGELLCGWEYVLVDDAFFGEPRRGGTPPHILVSMGGSDVHNATARVLAGLTELPEEFCCTVVIGPGFRTHRFDVRDPRFRFESRVTSLAGLMLAADVGVLLFGMTAYEAAAARLPCVLLADPPNLGAMQRFVGFGTAVELGSSLSVRPDQIREQTAALLQDAELHQRLQDQARAHAQPGGARRIAERVMTLAEEAGP